MATASAALGIDNVCDRWPGSRNFHPVLGGGRASAGRGTVGVVTAFFLERRLAMIELVEIETSTPMPLYTLKEWPPARQRFSTMMIH